MKNNKAFSLVEVISAFSLLTFILLTVLPILSNTRLLQMELAIERHAISTLHDELQSLPPSSIFPIVKTDDSTYPITYVITQTGDLIHGCATWKTFKQAKEEFCLYADF